MLNVLNDSLFEKILVFGGGSRGKAIGQAVTGPVQREVPLYQYCIASTSNFPETSVEAGNLHHLGYHCTPFYSFLFYS